MSARLAPFLQASAFAFRSFPLLLRLTLAFAPLGNKRHHHHLATFLTGQLDNAVIRYACAERDLKKMQTNNEQLHDEIATLEAEANLGFLGRLGRL